MKQAATKTTCTRSDLFEGIGGAYKQVVGSFPTRACAFVLLAQACLETSNGDAMYNWNIGGHKCPNPGPGDDWTEYPTTEGFGPSRRTIVPPNPGCQFRAYPTLEAGCVSQIQMLRGSFPAMFAAAQAGDAQTFALDGHKAGLRTYYTGDPNVYAADVVALVHEFAGMPSAAWELAAQAADTEPEITLPGTDGPSPTEITEPPGKTA